MSPSAGAANPSSTDNGVRGIPHARRTRKSSAELRTLLLDAARTTFADRGFSGATTREIAESAGTSEAVLFRHFGSKTGLFEASVIAPFASFIQRFADTWIAAEEPHPPEMPTHAFFAELYAMLRDQRDVVLTLIAAHQHEPNVEVDANIVPLLERIESVATRELEARGWREIDIPILVRIAFGMVLAAALFKEWLYVDHAAVPDDRIVDEMVAVLIGGASAGRGDMSSAACTIVEESDRGRVEFSGAEPVVLLSEASEWLARSGRAAESMLYQNGRLRLYY